MIKINNIWKSITNWFEGDDVVSPRPRILRPPTIEIRKDDPASAARSIRENCYFGVDELIEELKCQT